MTIILKPGQKKKNYEVVRELSRGAFAVSYEARNLLGESVFFKQYKSPSKLVDWYPGFVKHQQEIKKRIEKDPAAKERCYRFIEFFEDGEFFQVFEFINNGKALSECLLEPDRFDWNQTVIFAKVMMFGIKALHDIQVVHTDLKPDNIILIPDSTIGVGYRLRVIDLDWSIFSDKKAPWDGRQGYVGSPYYQSPEHVRNTAPLPASDIFTSAIMLGLLLGDGHPFVKHLGEAAAYDQAIKVGDFERIRLRHKLPGSLDNAVVEDVLNACLDPKPRNRPTAAQVCDALLGKKLDGDVTPGAGDRGKPATPKHARPTPTAAPKRFPMDVKAVEIRMGDRHVTTVSTNAVLGKRIFKLLDSDAQFMSDEQFRIYRHEKSWWIEHGATAINQTLVNGRPLVSPVPVENGMRISVGNAAKGIEKCVVHLHCIT
jgi:eukaryotic-like serine/threonine-protein kinase